MSIQYITSWQLCDNHRAASRDIHTFWFYPIMLHSGVYRASVITF